MVGGGRRRKTQQKKWKKIVEKWPCKSPLLGKTSQINETIYNAKKKCGVEKLKTF
jgi:hypothetical protein